MNTETLTAAFANSAPMTDAEYVAALSDFAEFDLTTEQRDAMDVLARHGISMTETLEMALSPVRTVLAIADEFNGVRVDFDSPIGRVVRLARSFRDQYRSGRNLSPKQTRIACEWSLTVYAAKRANRSAA